MTTKRWYHLYAEKHGFLVNNEIEDVIHEGLERKKQLFGVRYCPCKLVNAIENVCPCVEFRTEGFCHCGLFDTVNKLG